MSHTVVNYLQTVNSVIEDDADFVQWTFSTNNNTNTMTSRQQSRSNDTWSHDSSKTISLASLESVGKEDRKEPPFPSLKDCQG